MRLPGGSDSNINRGGLSGQCAWFGGEERNQRLGNLVVQWKISSIIERINPCALKGLAWRQGIKLPFEKFPNDAFRQMVFIEWVVYAVVTHALVCTGGNGSCDRISKWSKGKAGEGSIRGSRSAGARLRFHKAWQLFWRLALRTRKRCWLRRASGERCECSRWINPAAPPGGTLSR